MEINIRLSSEINKLFKAFDEAGFNLRMVGGAVRDILFGIEVKDYDFCADATPDEVEDVLRESGIKSLDYAKEYGTITALISGKTFEITSLRKDVECFGRKVVVEFTKDFYEDSCRRDFNINALYMDVRGEIYDYHNGLGDIEKRKLKFIGEAEARIHEDYLRILRFFRFMSLCKEYDKKSLEACVKLAVNLKSLSRERVNSEISRLVLREDSEDVIALMVKEGIFKYSFFGLEINEKYKAGTISSFLKTLRALGVGIEENREIVYFFCMRYLTLQQRPSGPCLKTGTMWIDKALKDLVAALNISSKSQKTLKLLTNIEPSEVKLSYNLYQKTKKLDLELIQILLSSFYPDDKEQLQKALDCVTEVKSKHFPITAAEVIKKYNLSGGAISAKLLELEEEWFKQEQLL